MYMNKEKVIYVGPSLSRGRLSHGRILIGGLPPELKRLQLEHPWLRYLFVPVGKYAEACKEIRKKGSAMALYYRKAKEV